jgi:hypothetical protein
LTVIPARAGIAIAANNELMHAIFRSLFIEIPFGLLIVGSLQNCARTMAFATSGATRFATKLREVRVKIAQECAHLSVRRNGRENGVGSSVHEICSSPSEGALTFAGADGLF